MYIYIYICIYIYIYVYIYIYIMHGMKKFLRTEMRKKIFIGHLLCFL